MITNDEASVHQPALQVLGPDQIEQIHRSTLQVLERTGIRITNPRALELLDGAGAKVNADRVRIPAEIVTAAIQSPPSCFALGNRAGEPAVYWRAIKSGLGPGWMVRITSIPSRTSAADSLVRIAVSPLRSRMLYPTTHGR